jgi:ComF family protein
LSNKADLPDIKNPAGLLFKTPLFTALLDFIFPPLCHVCRTFIPDSGPLHVCSTCLEQMHELKSPLCRICGIPFQGAGEDHLCGSCQQDRPSFDAARAAFAYDGHCRDLIHAFKYRNRTHLRRPLALLTIASLTEFAISRSPDLIVPVPLHVRRLRSRGFNQAVLLGELLAKEWHLPLERRALQRIRWTEPQINLTADERHKNLKGAFAVTDCAVIERKRVLLVDDVLTTGSTAEECSRVLKDAGAADVSLITVVRALKW